MAKTIVFCAGAPDPYVEFLDTITWDYLIGVDGGVRALLDAGYRLDEAFGDFDSVPIPTQVQNVTVLPCEKDDTDLEYALEHTLKQYKRDEIDKIVIIGALGGAGRLDHLLCNIWLYHQPRFSKWIEKIYFVERYNTVCAWINGKHVCYPEVNKKYVSFIGLTPIKQLHIEKAKYCLSGVNYHYPMALISNEFENHPITVSFEEGILLVMQTIDAKK